MQALKRFTFKLVAATYHNVLTSAMTSDLKYLAIFTYYPNARINSSIVSEIKFSSVPEAANPSDLLLIYYSKL